MNEEKSTKLEELEWDLQLAVDEYEESYAETRRLSFCVKEAEAKLEDFKESLLEEQN